jgi:hypothetical protein
VTPERCILPFTEQAFAVERPFSRKWEPFALGRFPCWIVDEYYGVEAKRHDTHAFSESPCSKVPTATPMERLTV